MDISEFKANPKTKYLAFQYEEMLKSDPETAKFLLTQMEGIINGGKSDNLDEDNSGDKYGSAREIILEIRAGAGGSEASLFARELGNMYSSYARKKGWGVVELDDLVYEIRGAGAYEALRWESGVHRIQRVPVTEKSGRVHTSTASVA
ncbi:MAG: PCRF domain-containing protein, partial [Patescibacteria group bacterium]